MNQAQRTKFKQSEAAVFERIKGFENGGTMPCEYPDCSCQKTQLTVTTFSVVVTPEFDILITCQSAAVEYAKKQNIAL